MGPEANLNTIGGKKILALPRIELQFLIGSASSSVLEKLVSVQLVGNFHMLYETWWFLTLLSRDQYRTLS
jgi:hypothetical protein